ncbi:GID complex subunit containing RING finger motif [Tulasnella sp. 419]|nr:GID complex subunit containing RING finger motif [Tulasnella sp. 419]
MDVYKVNHEGALLFEQPFIKVPFEQFRKIFKTSQRHIERDFTALQKDAADLAKKNPQGDDALKQLDAMINKVQGLKRKLSELHENSNAPAQASMRRRLDHLTDFEKLVSTEQPEFNAWSDTRLNRWLVDWALRNGREETAKAVAKNSDIEVKPRRHRSFL